MKILPAAWSVVRQPLFFAIALGSAVLVFLGAIIIPEFSFLKELASDPSISAASFSVLAQALVVNFFQIHQVISVALFMLISLLFGIETSLLLFYFTHRFSITVRGTAVAFSAILTAIFGLGCLSCGSLILFFIASTLGVGTTFAAAPNLALWFSLASAVILLFAIRATTRKIIVGNICPIE